jgi:hypothetical protein
MAKHAGGRPTKYSNEVALEICRRIPDESLRSICRNAHLPTKTTVFAWLLDGKHKEFSDQYNRAMDLRIDNMFDELDDIAHDGSNDWVERETKNGNIIETLNHEHIQRSRLRVDVIKWKLSKMNAKKYGDRIQQDHSGNVTINAADELIKALGAKD